MLQVGRLGCTDGGHTEGCAVPSEQLLNWTRAHFAAFAIVSAPLVLSVHPTDSTLEPLLDIIGNKQAIAVNEAWAGHPGTLLRTLPPAVPPAPPVRAGANAVGVPRNASDMTQTGWRYDAETHTIRQAQSGDNTELCLSCDGKDMPLTLTACGNATTFQNFTFDSTTGAFHISAPAGGTKLYPFCLSYAGGGPLAKIDAFSCTGAANEKWIVDSNYSTICLADGSGCLAGRDAYNPPPATVAAVQWWAKPLGGGRTAVLFLNGGALPYQANITLLELNVTIAGAVATDVWSGQALPISDSGVYDTGVVAPLDSRFVVLGPQSTRSP